MPSPQGSAGPYSPASHRMGTPNTGRDSSGSVGDGMYPMMKSGSNMSGVSNMFDCSCICSMYLFSLVRWVLVLMVTWVRWGPK